ncbi:MAG: sialate O-acetylesterase, partial [Planctomycetota bacterium]
PAEGWTPAEKLAGLGIDDDLAALTRVAKATPRRRSQAPSKLFNGMIAPLAPFGLTGAIWYQGENNVPRAANYDRVMRALIGSWRDAFETPDLPFLFVQLTGYDAWAKTNAQRVKAGEDPRPKPEGYVDPWPALRAAQAATSGLAGTGMAVTIDVGNETDIHPRNKRPVGERLALLARRIAYGDESVVAEGPTPVDAWTDGPRVTISFGDGGGGLRAGPEGGGRMIGGFELAGDDGVFRPARASLGYANSVNVRSDDVARPTRVRYAWADMPKGANLFGGTGLPAGPFELAVRPQTPPAVPEQSSLWLPSIFGDHMVVTEDFAVWGRSEPGAEVTVFVKPDVGPDAVTIDVGRSATADSEGRWRVDCGGLVGETVEMRVYAGDESVTFTDVLVGDVWLCGGQSNMEWSLARVHGGDRSKYGELLDDHDGHEIRLFTVRNAVSTTPAADVEGEWVVCDADTAENFSAVGYHFGVGVAEATGRPVGLISSNWGGSPVEFWTPASTLRELGRPVTEPAPTTKPNHRASQGFNAMIAPLLPLTLTGVAWYQGESNAGRAEQYESTFRAMIGSWRDAFADPDLPFLFVQLTGYDVPDDRSADGRWPELRAAQAAVLDLPATGMAVIYDVGAADNIHPPDKKTVGDRLALQARKLVYGDAEVIADGPTAVEVEFAGEAVTIRFDNSAGGLR